MNNSAFGETMDNFWIGNYLVSEPNYHTTENF